jgi:hypothetical protein
MSFSLVLCAWNQFKANADHLPVVRRTLPFDSLRKALPEEFRNKVGKCGKPPE